MKKLYYLLAGIGVILVTVIACESSSVEMEDLQTMQKEELSAKGANAQTKVDICHWTGKKWVSISVANASVEAHMNHGDKAPKTYYEDFDGDGFGSMKVFVAGICEAPDGYILDSGDCNDNDAAINPSATEVCGNDIDEDCSETFSTWDVESGKYDITFDIVAPAVLTYHHKNSDNTGYQYGYETTHYWEIDWSGLPNSFTITYTGSACTDLELTLVITGIDENGKITGSFTTTNVECGDYTGSWSTPDGAALCN